MLLSDLTNTIENSSLCTFIGMKHISPTLMYIIPMYLRLTTLQKINSPKCNFIYIFVLFLFRFGSPPMTLLTAGALTAPQLPATASNVCTTDARLGGVGRVPHTKKDPDYAGGCNEHQDAYTHLQGETVKTVKTFTYLGSTLAENWMRKSPTECKAGEITGRECLECCATGK